MRWWIVGAVAALVAAAAVLAPVRLAVTEGVPVDHVFASEQHCGQVRLGGQFEVQRRVPLVDLQLVTDLEVLWVDPSITVSATDACVPDVRELEAYALVWNPRCDREAVARAAAEQGIAAGVPGEQLVQACDDSAVAMRLLEEGEVEAGATWSGTSWLGRSGPRFVGGDMVWCVETQAQVTEYRDAGGAGVAETQEVVELVPLCVDLLPASAYA